MLSSNSSAYYVFFSQILFYYWSSEDTMNLCFWFIHYDLISCYNSFVHVFRPNSSAYYVFYSEFLFIIKIVNSKS